jgi:uncharacterized protein (DUF1697 family)
VARQVAFLRAINVGGHTVTMSRLREIFEELRFDDVETFIASGNVVFTSGSQTSTSMERAIAARLEEELGYEVVTFLRTAQEVVKIASHKAFPPAEVRKAGAYCIGFLARPLDAKRRKALAALTSPIDKFHVHDRQVYWLCQKQQHESKFSNVVFEKATGARVTFRGARTLSKLAVKLAASRSD